MNTNLKTRIRNLSDAKKTLGFLPKPKDVEAGAVLEIEGDLVAILSTQRDPRKLQALSRALESGEWAIESSPPPLSYDATLDVTKVVGVDNGVVVAQDPAWGAYSSSIGS